MMPDRHRYDGTPHWQGAHACATCGAMISGRWGPGRHLVYCSACRAERVADKSATYYAAKVLWGIRMYSSCASCGIDLPPPDRATTRALLDGGVLLCDRCQDDRPPAAPDPGGWSLPGPSVDLVQQAAELGGWTDATAGEPITKSRRPELPNHGKPPGRPRTLPTTEYDIRFWCPACGSLDTSSAGASGNEVRQYRRCRACEQRYSFTTPARKYGRVRKVKR